TAHGAGHAAGGSQGKRRFQTGRRGQAFLSSGAGAAEGHAGDGGRPAAYCACGQPRRFFGFAMALGREDYPGTPLAVVDCSVIAWPMEMMTAFMASNPALAVNTMQMIGRRLDAAHSRIREISTQEVEQRVAHAVLRLVREAGIQEDTGLRIDFPVSRQDIAELTGTTLHTVSRIVSQWQSKGWVEGGRQSLLVRDLRRLRQIAEGEI
ncbi:LOW QUALITY PROTEIN: bacterial regulatory protein, partial [Brucella melitensis bv. 1 str. 16M]